MLSVCSQISISAGYIFHAEVPWPHNLRFVGIGVGWLRILISVGPRALRKWFSMDTGDLISATSQDDAEVHTREHYNTHVKHRQGCRKNKMRVVFRSYSK